MKLKDSNLSYRNIEHWPDDEFVLLCEAVNSWDSEWSKVQEIASTIDDLTPLFGNYTRIVNGKVYSFGFKVNTVGDAERIGNLYVRYKVENTRSREAEIERRISDCFTNEAKIELIDEELRSIQAVVDRGRHVSPPEDFISFYISQGYRHSKTNKPLQFFYLSHPFTEFSFTRHDTFSGALILVTEGAIERNLEKFLLREKDQILHPENYPWLRAFQFTSDISVPRGRGGTDSFPPSFEDEKSQREQTPRPELTHAMHVLINYYKSEAGIEERKGRKEHLAEGGQNRYQKFTEISAKARKKEIPGKLSDLKAIYEYLKDYPTAKTLIDNHISQLDR